MIDDLRTIDRLAGRAAMASYARALPYDERYTVAHSAIAERVAEHALAGTRPTMLELVDVGSRAIDTETTSWRRDHGLAAPVGFNRFWLDDPEPLGRPDDEVPPRIALQQVLSALPARHVESLWLLALHGDPQAAAMAAGCAYSTMQTRIRHARIAFYALWFDGELPPEPPFDRRTSRPLADRCGAGHEWTPDNTRWRRASSGRGQKRACRACDRDAEQRRKARAAA